MLLFDLDLTLLRISDVNREAMSRAFAQLTGVPDAMATMQFAGRTDHWILAEAARLSGVPLDGLFARFAAVYPPLLAGALATHAPSALPGAEALLGALSERADVVLGVATGNMCATAHLKLAHAGLERFFDPALGAYGDEHLDRAELLRAAAIACRYGTRDRLAVIGDSEHDVRAARAVGAVAIGVTTGHRTAEELRAAGAAAVLPGLSGPHALATVLGA